MLNDERQLPDTVSGSTRAVHAGEAKAKPYGSLTTPIVQTSTYAFENTDAVIAHMERKKADLPLLRGEYGRYDNPTQAAVERKLAALDGAPGGGDGAPFGALLFASGMNAATTVLLTLLSPGDHLIMTDDLYRLTRDFALNFLKRFGIRTTLVKPGDEAALARALETGARLVFSEVPSNPYLCLIDIARAAEMAHAHGALLMIDTTFASPINLRPLALGADLVLHSATKYLGGHNDLLAGAVVGRKELMAQLRTARNSLGGIADAHAAYLLLRGIKTLAIRVQKQNENGLRVAEFLESHPKVRRVWYPGLPSHPDHALAKRQMSGCGGVVTFEIDGDLRRAGRFVDALQLPYIGPSLGGVESIVEQPALMSHFTKDKAEREAIGVRDELVRLALGIEDADDLIADLAQALEKI
jgi:cystathionine gamma-synthase